MYLSTVQLAQRRGTVTIKHQHDGARFTSAYSVLHYDFGGQLVGDVEIDYIDGEDARDTKSRAIAAVRMLGYWPELRREIARDRGTYAGVDVLTSPLVPPGEVATIDRLTDSGLILPPGV